MATISRFEDIEAWKHCRSLAREVYLVTLTGTFSRDYKLRDQINAAAGSAMDNIAEGFGRGGRNEFVTFLGITTGSLDEVKSQLYRALDREHINQQTFDKLYELADIAANKSGSFIRYLNSSNTAGQKFRDRTPSKKANN